MILFQEILSSMSMNHCHNDYTCISCCGLFNYFLDDKEKEEILKKRTDELNKIPENARNSRELLLAYRNKKENEEKSFPKFDYEIYTCPFVGYISQKKLGCMVHPTLTGDEKSQDVSLYGASICRDYDCRVKELDTKEDSLYLRLILKALEFYKKEQYELNFIYSRLISDYIFYSFTKAFFDREKILIYNDFLILFKELCDLRLKTYQSKKITSFEINYFSFVYNDENKYGIFEELFNKIFEIKIENELYKKFIILLK